MYLVSIVVAGYAYTTQVSPRLWSLAMRDLGAPLLSSNIVDRDIVLAQSQLLHGHRASSKLSVRLGDEALHRVHTVGTYPLTTLASPPMANKRPLDP